MSQCQCEVIERCFDTERVRRELTEYRRHGAASATRLLIEALQAESLEGMTLLDIGGGLGAIQHALVPALRWMWTPLPPILPQPARRPGGWA